MYTLLYLKWITTRTYCKHRRLCSVLCGSLDGTGIWRRMDTRIWMAKSLHWSPETTTTLLIGYTPIQNKKFKFERKDEILEPLKSGSFSSFTRALLGFPGGTRGKETACECRHLKSWGFDPWGRARQPTPIFLPGESLGQRNLQPIVHEVKKSPTGLKRLSTPGL